MKEKNVFKMSLESLEIINILLSVYLVNIYKIILEYFVVFTIDL